MGIVHLEADAGNLLGKKGLVAKVEADVVTAI